MKSPLITVLHHDDMDGFGAAYAIWKKKGQTSIMTFIPVQYGQPVPEIDPNTETLFIVDFSYDKETCLKLKSRFDNVVILDHHRSAEKELIDLPFAIFDMNKSGCMMAWDFCFPGKHAPTILKYIQDRDLWTWDLPDSEEVNVYIGLLPYKFEVFDEFQIDVAKNAGEAILMFRDNQIRYAMKRVRVCKWQGYKVPMVNATENISELGEAMNNAYPDTPFSVSYFSIDGGIKYSLRSKGNFDVSEVAKSIGGGGHKNAAGAAIKIETTI